MSEQVDTRTIIAKANDSRLTKSPSIILDRITHHFGTRCVFRDVSSTIQSGELLVVSGANGSGKSTLLRIIAGLLTPTAGSVEISANGSVLQREESRRSIGYVAPDLVLYRELTGAENLQFFAELHGVPLDRNSIVGLLTRVGLRGRGRDLVGAYSSGMRQRLKYAFALLHDPPVLLLDEPSANLDVDGIAIVENVVEAQQKRKGGGLTIVATNEPRELAWSSNRIHLEAGA